MEKKVKYLTIAVIALSVVSLATIGIMLYGTNQIKRFQNPNPYYLNDMKRGFEHHRKGMPFIEERLGLNNEQADKVRAKRHKFFVESNKNMQEFQSKRRSLRLKYISDKTDDKEIKSLLDSIGNLAVENEKSLAMHFKSIYEVLDKEQKKEFLTLIDSIEVKMHKRRPMHRYQREGYGRPKDGYRNGRGRAEGNGYRNDCRERPGRGSGRGRNRGNR